MPSHAGFALGGGMVRTARAPVWDGVPERGVQAELDPPDQTVGAGKEDAEAADALRAAKTLFTQG